MVEKIFVFPVNLILKHIKITGKMKMGVTKMVINMYLKVQGNKYKTIGVANQKGLWVQIKILKKQKPSSVIYSILLL